jgi:16S rRNA (cytidine1402-2'-O)-methyltransferase
VIGPGAEGAADESKAREAVEALVDAGAKRRAAAKVVSDLTGVPANRLYRD